jgi:hypothetical protein
VQYALFLIGEVLPSHDELCHAEGMRMLDYLAGRREAGDELSRGKGACRRFFARYAGTTR